MLEKSCKKFNISFRPSPTKLTINLLLFPNLAIIKFAFLKINIRFPLAPAERHRYIPLSIVQNLEKYSKVPVFLDSLPAIVLDAIFPLLLDNLPVPSHFVGWKRDCSRSGYTCASPRQCAESDTGRCNNTVNGVALDGVACDPLHLPGFRSYLLADPQRGARRCGTPDGAQATFPVPSSCGSRCSRPSRGTESCGARQFRATQ